MHHGSLVKHPKHNYRQGSSSGWRRRKKKLSTWLLGFKKRVALRRHWQRQQEQQWWEIASEWGDYISPYIFMLLKRGLLSSKEAEIAQYCGRCSCPSFSWWQRRSLLFSCYSPHHILMSRESWYSVTPVEVADAITAVVNDRLGRRRGIVLEPYGGMGGNTVSFLNAGHFCVLIEKNPLHAAIALQNISYSTTSPLFDIVVADVGTLRSCFRTNAVFISPPWGGSSYKATSTIHPSVLWSAKEVQMIQRFLLETQLALFYLPYSTENVGNKELFFQALKLGASDNVPFDARPWSMTSIRHAFPEGWYGSLQSCFGPAREHVALSVLLEDVSLIKREEMQAVVGYERERLEAVPN